jgi:hypothetical protein
VRIGLAHLMVELGPRLANLGSILSLIPEHSFQRLEAIVILPMPAGSAGIRNCLSTSSTAPGRAARIDSHGCGGQSTLSAVAVTAVAVTALAMMPRKIASSTVLLEEGEEGMPATCSSEFGF